jgi:phosphoribosyl-ATP pyrophosphohydrolase/phosphoribosyl-AMP cyclohydrolase/histidinol dehydrogenase
MLVSIGLLIIWFHLISHTSNFVVAFSLSLHHTKKMTGNNDKYLTPITPDQVTLEIKDPVDPTALEQAKGIISRIKNDQGTIDPVKLMNVAQDLGDIPKDDTSFVVQKEECKLAFEGLTDTERNSLINIHARVKAFAEAQRNSVTDMEIDIPGGKAGHTVRACYAAGCYAPGGRYPLPSSVIMTAVTAKAAGCKHVVLASPRPAPITLAAAYIAGADLFLKIGGAQAIATMAYGIETESEFGPVVPRCDTIVGPGNKWVTAAKSIVQGYCGIDMLAGPSEVLVICDDTANAEVVAADLIAQAEHDVVARAILLSNNQEIIDQIEKCVGDQLESLPEPNKSTASEAFKQSFAVLCQDLDECVKISDDIAPEHLEIQTRDAMKIAQQCSNYGGLFVGEHAAEVLGDYGAGPNHTLPTGGTGRYTGGLSVFNFLSIRTWMRIDNQKDSQDMVNDSIVMARLEGLEGHARAAEARSLSVEPAYKKAK